jgi:hypothetical protein
MLGQYGFVSFFICLLFFGMQPSPVWGQLQITKIEVNQAIGNQLQGHTNFVAGKNTVIRAFLSEPVTVSRRAKMAGLENTSAVVKCNGQVVTTLSPKSSATPTSVVDFVCPNLSACGNWEAGAYDFEVTVKGATLTSEGNTFVDRNNLKILAVPIKGRYGKKIVDYPDEKWKTLWEFTRNVYPVSHDGIKWKNDELMDFSASEYDLKTNDGRWEVWNALKNLNPKHCPPTGKTPGNDCYDLIVGFIPESPPKLAGFTWGTPANVVTGTDDDAAATVAHEMAHCYLIGDTYKEGVLHCSVNPAPDGWKGEDWDDRSKTVSCDRGAKPYGQIGTKVPAAANPYDVTGRGLLADMADFMGCDGKADQFWITPDTYDWLFNQFAPAGSFSRTNAAVLQRVVAYSGRIAAANNSIILDPWESYMDTVDIPDTTGTITIKALDANGNVVATQALSADFFVNTDPPTKVTQASFMGTMRFPEGVMSFQIVEGSTILKELQVSSTLPQIGNVTPTTPGTTIAGQYTITWTATDAASNPLTYTVEYNPDTANSGSQWSVLTSELSQKQWTENFDNLPGGTSAQIRVTATDGVNAVSATSAVFTVSAKLPEVFIGELEWGKDYEYGAEVLLEAEAYDLQDGWLPDNQIVWSSNLNGILGVGETLIVDNLDPGEHIITASATNSSGLSASAQTTLTVSSCDFSLSETSLSFNQGGGTATIDVTATQSLGSNACSLTNDDITVTTDDGAKWLQAKVVNFKDNKGKVNVRVSSNTGNYQRAGSILIMGNKVSVTQDKR